MCCHFSQKFIGYRDGKVWYSDTTSKKDQMLHKPYRPSYRQKDF